MSFYIALYDISITNVRSEVTATIFQKYCSFIVHTALNITTCFIKTLS